MLEISIFGLVIFWQGVGNVFTWHGCVHPGTYRVMECSSVKGEIFRVGISVSADIEYRPIYANIGKTELSVSVF